MIFTTKRKGLTAKCLNVFNAIKLHELFIGKIIEKRSAFAAEFMEAITGKYLRTEHNDGDEIIQEKLER